MIRALSFKTLAVSALFLAAAYGTAQESFTIKMNIKAEGLPPEYAGFAEQEITNYIKGDKLKTEQNGMMGTTTTVYDGKKMTTIMETMGNKMGYTATKEELESYGKNDKTEKPKIEYTNDKKMIAGYECTKTLITSVGKDKKENITTMWVTDKIKYSHPEARKASGRSMMDLSDLKGYPLAMEMSQNSNGMDVKIIMTTTEIKTDALDDGTFVLNTDGYNMMTYKEMMDKQKAMMQGGK